MHIVLLGDSIVDNKRCVGHAPIVTVIGQTLQNHDFSQQKTTLYF